MGISAETFTKRRRKETVQAADDVNIPKACDITKQYR